MVLAGLPKGPSHSHHLAAKWSLIHLEVSEEAEMEKKAAWMLEAMALPSRVLPVPGGPKRRMPLGGARAPWF